MFSISYSWLSTTDGIFKISAFVQYLPVRNDYHLLSTVLPMDMVHILLLKAFENVNAYIHEPYVYERKKQMCSMTKKKKMIQQRI